MKNPLIFLFAVILSVAVFSSCSKEDNNDAATFSQNYIAQLNGVNAVPTNSSSATAMLNAVYSSNTQTFNFTITYSGMAPTSWAIHSGAKGVVGPIEFALGAITPSPYSGSIVLTAAQLSNLAAGLYYVNIVSGGFPGGEVRGQITKK